MENIRNYKTNCKENLMNFYHFKNKDKSRCHEEESGSQRD